MCHLDPDPDDPGLVLAEEPARLAKWRKPNRKAYSTQVTSCANDIFQSIFACCSEHEHSQPEVNLLLRTYSNQAENDGGIAFDILFAPEVDAPYHEVQILSPCSS